MRSSLLRLFMLSTLLLTAAAPTWQGADLTRIDGEPLPAASLAGKVVLVVNIASYCGYTGQLQDLQLLFSRYQDRGLMLLGVPSDQFGQEPGTEREVRNFCTSRYGVQFPLLRKQAVNGPERSALYRALVDSKPGGGRDITWNFEKFLVDRNGEVIARFPPYTVPLEPQLVAAIELALASKATTP